MIGQKELPVKGGRVLILGLAFMENTGDVRNSKVIDVYQELKSFGTKVDVFDTLANLAQALRKYGIFLIKNIELSDYQAVLLAAPHKAFSGLTTPSSKEFCQEPLWTKVL